MTLSNKYGHSQLCVPPSWPSRKCLSLPATLHESTFHIKELIMLKKSIYVMLFKY